MNCNPFSPEWHKDHEFGELVGELQTFFSATGKWGGQCGKPTFTFY